MAERFRSHLLLCAVIMILIAFGGILPIEAVAWLAIGSASTVFALGLDWIIQRLLHPRKRKNDEIDDWTEGYLPDKPDPTITPPSYRGNWPATYPPKPIKPKPKDTSYGTRP